MSDGQVAEAPGVRGPLLAAPARARGLADRVLPLVPFAPAAIVLGLCLAWLHQDGGYFPRDWYPGEIAVLWLAVVVAVAQRRALPAGRWPAAGLLLIAGLTAWSALSIAWSPAKGAGLESVHLLVLIVAACWVLALAPWTERAAAWVVGGWSLGVAVIGAISLVDASSAADLTPFLTESRFSDPVGYTNAVAAVSAMAVFPALWLSARDRSPLAVRALALGTAAFLAQFALLTQSRAAAVGLAIAAVVCVALAGRRLHLVTRLVVVGGAVAATASPALEFYDRALHTRPIGDSLDVLARGVFVASAAAVLAGVLLVLLERRVKVAVPRPGTRTRTGLWIALALALVVVAALSAGRVADAASDRWRTFSSDVEIAPDSGPRLLRSSSDQRYDYWRVALNMFRDDPVRGAGASSFEAHYTAERHRPRHSRYAHSLPFRVLAEGGIVGALLLAGFLVAAFAGLIAAARRLGPSARTGLAACGAVFTYFVVHVSFDWLEQFAALAIPGLGLVFVGLALRGGAAPAGTTRRLPRPARVAAVAAAAVLLCAVTVSAAASWTAESHVEQAYDSWRSSPATAWSHLASARDANPLSLKPLLAEGTIAVSVRDNQRARRAFEDSLDVEAGWYAHYELAMLASQAGDFGEARRRIEAARRLNPLDPLVLEVRGLIAARRRIDPRSQNIKIFELTLRKYRVRP